MSYKSLTVGLPRNFVSGQIDAGLTWGGATIATPMNIPDLPPVALGLWPGTGSQVGLVNLLNLAAGTLINTTPGTTDTADIDLTAIADYVGASKSYVELCMLLILNYATTDGANNKIVVGGSSAAPATNPWTAPFTSMATPNLGRIDVAPGYTDPATSQTVPGGLILWAGNLAAFPVNSGSKVLRLYSPSALAGGVPYRVVLAGRDAAS